MNREHKWFLKSYGSAFAIFSLVMIIIIKASTPEVVVNTNLSIPQVNLAKIYVLATEIRKDMKENPDLFDEEPNEHMIRNMLVFSQDYGECRESDMNWDETLACRDTITQREVDLVRLAYTDLDSFTIEVEE